jgi:hypothetical protein
MKPPSGAGGAWHFPEFLPPFLEHAVTFATDGSLWVKRTTAAEDPPTFDVFSPSGQTMRRIVLPERSKLVGFGKGVVYLAHIDDDDLQYLRRYELPDM